jgi:ABC-2 type transport system ATP-binding protein
VGVHRDRVQRRIGYVPGDFVAYGDLTGRDYLRHLACLRGGVDDAVVTGLATRLGADLDRRIRTLSHGNRQKIGVIQAFMHEPELLVLDEPTTGLDPLVQREFLAMVREVRDSGRTVFLSSHVLSEVESVADTIAILREGRVVVTDTVERLKQQVLRRIDLVFSTPPPDLELGRLPGVREVHRNGVAVEVTVEGSTAALLTAAAPYGIENVVSHEPDLEDVFLGWYEQGADR